MFSFPLTFLQQPEPGHCLCSTSNENKWQPKTRRNSSGIPISQYKNNNNNIAKSQQSIAIWIEPFQWSMLYKPFIYICVVRKFKWIFNASWWTVQSLIFVNKEEVVLNTRKKVCKNFFRCLLSTIFCECPCEIDFETEISFTIYLLVEGGEKAKINDRKTFSFWWTSAREGLWSSSTNYEKMRLKKLNCMALRTDWESWWCHAKHVEEKVFNIEKFIAK